MLRECKNIQRELLRNIKQSFTVTIGEMINSFSDINYYYRETKKASQFRLIKGSGNIFQYNELMDYDAPDSSTSISYHKRIIELLLSGKYSDVQKKYQSLINYLVTTTPVTAIFAHTRLAFMLYESVFHLLNDSQSDGFKLHRVVTMINNAESIDEIKQYFIKLFYNIHQIRQDINKHNHKDLIENVKAYIAENFSDPNLSQSCIADKFCMSTTYLGRIFRQLTNQSIADSINEIRIIKSERLIADTNLNIIEITERIGIQNTNYFYSLFKKKHGVTPSVYRKSLEKFNS